MSVICPTVTALDAHEYREQLERIAPFAERIHLDFMDGNFAPTVSLSLEQAWMPENKIVDIHVMYKNPEKHLDTLIRLQPNMVIVHAESNCDIPAFAARLREHGIKTGVAILQGTAIEDVAYLFPHVQHVLIFSGDLGHFGGHADMALTEKVAQAKHIHKFLELGWDGGINEENVAALAKAGINVLNVGGAIQKSENPESTYATMKSKIDSHA